MKKIFSTIIALMATLAVSAQSTKEYVDLGLPSGTLWATCNVGASKPEECGDYFAWGETAPKEDYLWSNYKWLNEEPSSLYEVHRINKYTSPDHDQKAIWYDGDTFIGDGKTKLDPEDDAATANWGSGWCMPTSEQYKELTNSSYTDTEWTTLNGVYGRKITSKINGHTIFFPAAGFRSSDLVIGGNDNDFLENQKDLGVYWGGELDVIYHATKNATAFYFDVEGTFNGNWFCYRYVGCSVRPVRSEVTTSINSVTGNQKATKRGKYISGGNLVIEREGKQYNVSGTITK